MARARRSSLYHVDQSWQKFARCKMCGFKTCINNYPDHKPRISHLRVKGVFVCPWCVMRMRFGVELYLLVKELATEDCKKGGCGKCKRCRAKTLIESREQYQSHNVALDIGV